MTIRPSLLTRLVSSLPAMRSSIWQEGIFLPYERSPAVHSTDVVHVTRALPYEGLIGESVERRCDASRRASGQRTPPQTGGSVVRGEDTGASIPMCS